MIFDLEFGKTKKTAFYLINRRLALVDVKLKSSFFGLWFRHYFLDP